MLESPGKVIIEASDINQERNKCKYCEFNSSFLCDVKLLFEIQKYAPFDIQIFKTDVGISKLIAESYKQVLENHRKGRYFTFNFTPFHCSHYCKTCKCDKHRCWNFEEVPARKIPRCIGMLGIDIDKIEQLNGVNLDNIYFLIDFTSI